MDFCCTVSPERGERKLPGKTENPRRPPFSGSPARVFVFQGSLRSPRSGETAQPGEGGRPGVPPLQTSSASLRSAPSPKGEGLRAADSRPYGESGNIPFFRRGRTLAGPPYLRTSGGASPSPTVLKKLFWDWVGEALGPPAVGMPRGHPHPSRLRRAPLPLLSLRDISP